MSEYFLSLKGISKIFPGVKALSEVDLDIKSGEVHALCGENGAGKSTLIKILTGAYQYDEGQMYHFDKALRYGSTKDAFNIGVACIYQELSLAPNMTVTENIYLGRELRLPGMRLLDYTTMNRKAKETLLDIGLDIDVTVPVSNYAMGYQQMIEIARALLANAKMIIMDEPTSSLSNREVDVLLENIRKLREKGIAVVYISHRLEEVLAISDRITIMRDGCKIATMVAAEATEEKLIKLMVGRNLDEKFPKIPAHKGDIALRVSGLQRKGVLKDIDFELYKGEVLGFAGLVGAGRTELARAIFGADKIDSGSIEFFGKKVSINSPQDAIRHGMAFLTEDRKRQGLVLMHDILFNASLAALNYFSKWGFINVKKVNQEVVRLVTEMQLRPPDPYYTTRLLSGGNQQKVVIAKWLCLQSKIFIFDEPTRGIDVGAKVEVYNLINRLVAEGAAVIVISSEMPEVIGISDRILVMHDGQIKGRFARAEVTPELIMKSATGGGVNKNECNNTTNTAE